MGEGLKHMYDEVSSSRPEEDYEELGSLSEEEEDQSDDDTSQYQQSYEVNTMKKGLSKYYKGKSQSFTSFSDLSYSVEDLAKKDTPYKKKMTMMQSCRRSYAGGLNQESNNNNIPNKVSASRGNLACSTLMSRTASGTSFFSSSKPPMGKNI